MATTEELLRQQQPALADEINKYIDELKSEAQGDYDFVVKFLKQQFQTALGTDDQARANFFANVANQLEARIGRIPYDYDLKTGREKEDLAIFLKTKDAEDTRQRELETEFKAQQDLATKTEQQAIKESVNKRGLLDSGIQKKQSQEATETRQTNVINPQMSTFAYQQALRNKEREQAALESNRNLADITTEARRAGQDTQFDYTYGTEKAQKTLSQRLAEINREKTSQYRTGLALTTGQTYANL